MSSRSETSGITCDVSECALVEAKLAELMTDCRASTSRGLSHSSGDYDEEETHVCSCYNTITPTCNRPCFIVDSCTQLQKSKWKTFKNYFKKLRNKSQMKYDDDKQKKKHGKKDSNFTHDSLHIMESEVTTKSNEVKIIMSNHSSKVVGGPSRHD